MDAESRRFLRRWVPASAFVGGLCCFAPVVTVLLGLGSASYAASMTDVLYYEYAWAFRLAGLGLLLGAFGVHLYTRDDICTVDDVVRRRRRWHNLLAAAVSLAAVAYAVWLYVVVEIVGIALSIW